MVGRYDAKSCPGWVSGQFVGLSRGLCGGVGAADGQMCIMAAVSILNGDPFGDEIVDPVTEITAIAAGGAGGEDSAFGGSVPLNVISNTIDA